MILKSIHLTSFRNIDDLEITFDTPITLFVGQNGQGKTNILESIHMLSRGFSFATKNHREIISFGAEWFRISGQLEEKDEVLGLDTPHELSIGTQLMSGPTRTQLKKAMKLDGADISSKELAGRFPSVTFLPDELNLLSGEPALRRKLLNASLIQTDKEYFNYLVELELTLKSRNKLLKGIREGSSSRTEIEYWNTKLIDLNEKIGIKRLAFVEHLAELIEKIYQRIAKSKDNISINYEPTQNLAAYMRDNFEKEIILARTLKGPHREDFEVMINRQPFKSFGSRGEHRSMILAIKIAELDYLHQELGKRPILLLDDVMSELDRDRQQTLLENIAETQTFITTTNAELFQKNENYKIIEIQNGKTLQ